MSGSFDNLIGPTKLGNYIVPSRAFVTAHSSSSLSEPGTISERLKNYISAYANSGAAAFFLGETVVSDGTEVNAVPWGMGTSKSGIEREYARLIESLSGSQMLIFEQLSHFGGQTWSVPGAMALAPSSISQEISGLTPSPMSQEDIGNTKKAYFDAASRAAKGGLHGLELKCDQGKLLHQFLSRYYNQRTDEYGGSLKNRLRIVREISESCAEIAEQRAGSRMLMSIRLSLTHLNDDRGYPQKDNSELIELVQMLEEWGIFDLISVNLHTNSTYFGYSEAHPTERGLNKDVVEALSALVTATRTPVVYSGGIDHPSRAEWLLMATGVSFVGMTRAMIADPTILIKASDRRIRETRPCIGCNQGCVGNTWEGRPLSCTVNPLVGTDPVTYPTSRPVTIVPSQESEERIAIVGSGPAGLEVALRCASWGKRVLLFEKDSKIGGKLSIAGSLPQKHRFLELVTFFEDQISDNTRVELYLNTRVGPHELNQFDWVIDARGAAQQATILDKNGVSFVSAVDAVLLPADFWVDRTVMIADEDWIQDPLAIALHIQNCGGKVSYITTTREFVGMGLDVVNLTMRLSELRSFVARKSPKMLSFSKIEDVDGDGRVIISDLCTMKRQKIRGTDVVVSVTSCERRHPDWLPETDADIRTIRVGDARAVRGIEYAIRDGYSAALQICGRNNKT